MTVKFIINCNDKSWTFQMSWVVGLHIEKGTVETERERQRFSVQPNWARFKPYDWALKHKNSVASDEGLIAVC